MARLHTAMLAVLLAALPGPALSFNFGMVRVPDWMDRYFLILLPIVAGAFALTALVKPHGLPINRIPHHFGQVGFFTRLSYLILAASFAITMILLFVGMGLRRAAEL
ncbi:MAG: hypothetical protein R3D63_07275 [Paracoccaceae bacterium]